MRILHTECILDFSIVAQGIDLELERVWIGEELVSGEALDMLEDSVLRKF